MICEIKKYDLYLEPKQRCNPTHEHPQSKTHKSNTNMVVERRVCDLIVERNERLLHGIGFKASLKEERLSSKAQRQLASLLLGRNRKHEFR